VRILPSCTVVGVFIDTPEFSDVLHSKCRESSHTLDRPPPPPPSRCPSSRGALFLFAGLRMTLSLLSSGTRVSRNVFPPQWSCWTSRADSRRRTQNRPTLLKIKVTPKIHGEHVQGERVVESLFWIDAPFCGLFAFAVDCLFPFWMVVVALFGRFCTGKHYTTSW